MTANGSENGDWVVWLNGELVPEHQAVVPIRDRGFKFGDAAFSRFVNTMAETFAHLKVSLMIFDQQHRLTLFNPATIELFGGDPAWFARRPSMAEILDAMRETRAVPEQADFIKWRDDLLGQILHADLLGHGNWVCFLYVFEQTRHH